jgi:hypothetical protein
MVDFINQGRVKLPQPLSRDELIILREFIRNLEKEGLLPKVEHIREVVKCETGVLVEKKEQAVLNKKLQELVKQGIILTKIIGDLEKEGISISDKDPTSLVAQKEEL